jgi:hypothetical protein
MGTDDPSKPGLAEVKGQISEACLQSVCFCLAPFALRMRLCIRLFVLSVSFDALAPARLPLWANLRLLFLASALMLDCG